VITSRSLIQGEGEEPSDEKILSKRESRCWSWWPREDHSSDQRALEISPKTVARHRERIMNKLNLHSAAELVRFAIRKGIIRAASW
jgi:two-component system, NarL family, response regulator NreC